MLRPHVLAENLFNLNGSPLRLPADTMRHLFPIYDKSSSSTLLKFGRQTHKSTTLGYKLAIPPVKYGNYHALYVAPTGNQVSVFSSDKLNSAIHDSDIISTHYFDTKTKDQVSYKEFRNGSKIYLRSAFHTADSIRGISSDMVMIDEVQDIISDHIPVIEQCMSHSLAKWEYMAKFNKNLPMHLFNCRMYAGTPKTIENVLERYFEQSTQCEWIIRCLNQGCKKWNFINEYNIGDTCLICNRCGKPIFYQNGMWVEMNHGGIIEGYRLPQIVLPWINNINNPKSWQLNVINTRKIYSSEKYFNEILAMSYAAAKHPISAAELKACCDEDWPMIEPQLAIHDVRLRNTLITAGIDWGKGDTASGTSYTILTVSVFVIDRFRTIFMKKYTGRMSDPLLQVEDIIKIIQQFDCDLTIADTGDGRTSNAMVVKSIGANKFAEIYEHGSIRQKIKFDKEKGFYIMNRSRIMTDRIMEIKNTKVSFFKYDEFKEFQPDFTGIYSEYSEITRISKYDHLVPDDCFHSWMFSKIAMDVLRGELSRYLSGGVNVDEDEDHGRALGVEDDEHTLQNYYDQGII